MDSVRTHYPVLEGLLKFVPPSSSFFFFFVLSVLVLVLRRHVHRENEPPKLSESIPYITNTWQYINDRFVFMQRVW